MDFDLPNWNKLGEAQWGGHPLLVFEKNSALLMLLAEKRGERVIGFACSACKPFEVKGDAGAIDLIHFPSDLTLVKKLNARGHKSFLLAFTRPSYSAFSPSSLANCVEFHAKQLGEIEFDVKTASKVVLADLENGDFLATPEVLFSLLSSLRSASKPFSSRSLLGLGLTGEKAVFSVASASLGLVVGGEKQQRLHVLHLLVEEALMQNICVVVFDSCNAFAGLSRPGSAELSEYASFSLPGLPAGFPTRELLPGKNAFIPLSAFSPSAIASSFGIGESDVSRYVAEAIQKGSFEAPETELNQFSKLRVNRTLKLLSHSLQGIFADKGELEFSYSLGKVLHVNLSALSQEARAFFALGLLKQLESVNRPVFLVFEQDAGEVKALLKLAIDKFLGSHVSILCHSEDENDVSFVKSADLFVEVLGSDVAVTEAGKQLQRVKLRPAYSACTEL